MFSLLDGSTGSPRIEKEVHELLFTVYNQRDIEGLKECLQKSDALDVFRMLQEVNREITSVKLENIVLIDFLQKNDPKLLIGLDHVRQNSIDILNSTMERRKSHTEGSEASPNLARTESRATSIAGSTMGSMRKIATDYRINYRTKVKIAEKLAGEIQTQCEDLEAKSTNQIKILKGQIEEKRYHCADTKETIINFEKQFLQNDELLVKATQKQKETLLRKFINNWLKNGRALLGTMRLKITSIQEHCHQQRTALLSKADLSGMLGPVDFEQLQIKRDDQTRSLDEKNVSLAGLKEVTGKASLALAKEKKNLLALEQKCKVLNEKTADVVKKISKLEKESKIVEKEMELAEDSLKNIKMQAEEFEAPSITDYILKKQELLALEKEHKLLQRKSYIQNIKLQNVILKLRAKNEK